MKAAIDSLTIVEAARLMEAGDLTSESLTRACLDRIAAKSELNAFIAVFEEAAMAAARVADRERAAGRSHGALHGIPISLKDLIDVRGTRTTAASRVRDDHLATEDAPVVERLRNAGAVIVGKCNLHEFAYGTTSEESAYGPVHHPLYTTRCAGGSSGGSAVAVATGMSLASIGTDTGGSIRIPAAACGVVGLKPTLGEVPLDGIVPLVRSHDHVGPLARTATDAWLVFQALMNRRVEAPAPPREVSGLRIGVPRDYFFDLLDEDVRKRTEEAFERLRRAGASLVDVTIPHAADSPAIYLHIALPEASAYHASALETCPEKYTMPVRLRLELGRTVLAEDYVRAQIGRERVRADVDRAFEDGCDVLALPALAIPAPLAGASTVRIGEHTEPVRTIMLRLTQPFNVSGHPAISMPSGMTTPGLPCGLQLVGRRGRTDELLRTALACEPYVTVGTAMSGGGTG